MNHATKRACALAMALAVLLLAGCHKDAQKANVDTRPGQTVSQFDHAGYDWAVQLEREAFAEDGTVGHAVKSSVRLQVKAATDSTLTVAVSAPQITQPLLEWYDAQTEFSGEALEAKIEELLQGKKEEQEFVLTYTVADGVPVITYPSEYVKALSCGVSDFYDILYARIMDQMGGTDNG